MENYPSFNPNAPKGMPKSQDAVKNTTQPMQQRPMAHKQQQPMMNQMYQPQKVMQAQRYPQFNQGDGIDWEKVWNDIKNMFASGGEAINRNTQNTNDWWNWRSQQEQQYSQQNPQYPFWSGLQRAVNTAPQWIPNAVDMFKNTFK